MNIIAIDTSAEACSAALYQDGQIAERFEIAPRRHSELILGMVDGLLALSGLSPRRLDAIAFGRGPGSFTGLRIATGVAQGMAYGLDLPVVPISTLRALAQGIINEHGVGRVLTAFDARMNEIYWARFELGSDGLAFNIGPEMVVPAAKAPLPEGGGWVGAGSGWKVYHDVLVERLGGRVESIDAEAQVHAREIAFLAAHAVRNGEQMPPEQALPVYLRDRVVTVAR